MFVQGRKIRGWVVGHPNFHFSTESLSVVKPLIPKVVTTAFLRN